MTTATDETEVKKQPKSKNDNIFMADKQELKPGLVIFRRTDVQHGNWYCRVKIPKEDRYKTVSLKTSDINEARTKAYRADYDVHFRIEHNVPIFENTFAQVAQEYLDYQLQLAKAGRITMDRWKIVRSYVEHHLNPFTGHLPVTHVGQERWDAYPVWRKTEGGNIVIRKGKHGAPDEKKIVAAKDGAIRQEMKTFRAILNFAADKNYLRERQIPRGNIPLDDARREAFTPTEYKHLHTHARTEWVKKGATATQTWYRKMAYEFMLIMANTGMRPPEARNLRWRDFDMRTARNGRQFACLNVRGKKKYRELVATPNVATYLDRVRELAENPPQKRKGAKPEKRTIKLDDFVFTNAKGASATDLYDTLITDLLKDAGLLMSSSGSRRSTYCFRHTYATFRLIEGVDVIWLAKQMGTSVKMIEKHYGHITPTTDAGRILQGTPGWEAVADGSGENSGSVNAGGAGSRPAKPRTKK